MLDKPIDTITKEDLEALVNDGTPEGRRLDYKRTLPSKDEKREFVYDVSAFANASGGLLIFGVDEDRDASGQPTGRPLAPILGLSGVNLDKETLRLHGSLETGVTPRIPNVQMRPIALDASRSALVVRVPRSLARPHMVTVDKLSRFYSRNSGGKHQMDWHEIRDAFLSAADLGERVRRFREDRLALLERQAGPIPVSPEAKLVLHVIPLVAFELGYQIDLGTVAGNVPWPLGGDPTDYRFNFDGFLVFDRRRGSVHTYIQVFRTGIIETVATSILRVDEDSQGWLDVSEMEAKLVKRMGPYVTQLKGWGIAPPLLVTVSLLGVRGFRLNCRNHRMPEGERIDRATLAAPEIVIEEEVTDWGAALRPAFDPLWQAAGLSGSLNYPAGKWNPIY